MGCDYYTQIVLIIEYLDSDNIKKQIQEYEARHPRYCCIRIDDDLEEPPDELEMECAEYGKKVMYENNVWTCTETGKERVLQLCKKINVNAEQILTAYKVKTGWWR
jgi:hypothetical protein